MSKLMTNTKVFEEWANNLSLEENVMRRIMDAYLEDCYNYDPGIDYIDDVLVTTSEIMDAASDIGPLDPGFVNKYMMFLGYRLSRACGRVAWHIWR